MTVSPEALLLAIVGSVVTAGRRDVSEIPEKPRIHTGPAGLIRSNRRRSGHRTKLRNVNL